MRKLVIVLGCCARPTIAQVFYAVNSSSTTTGPWEFTPSGFSTSDYLTADLSEATNADSGNVSVVFNAEVSQNGNYSVTLYTPGCIESNECAQRGIVNVTGQYVNSVTSESPLSTQVYQTNNYDKYDEIYLGLVNISDSSFRPTVTLAAIPGFKGIIVAQRVKFVMLNSTINGAGNGESSATPNATAPVQTDSATTTASVTVIATAPAAPGGLDGGAKIGLGVGISLGFLLCAIIALAVYVRLQRARIAREEKILPHRESREADSFELMMTKSQGESSSCKELPGGSSRKELPGESSRTELPDGPSHTELPGRSVLPYELSVLDS